MTRNERYETRVSRLFSATKMLVMTRAVSPEAVYAASHRIGISFILYIKK
jgi:hypothetical protein